MTSHDDIRKQSVEPASEREAELKAQIAQLNADLAKRKYSAGAACQYCSAGGAVLLHELEGLRASVGYNIGGLYDHCVKMAKESEVESNVSWSKKGHVRRASYHDGQTAAYADIAKIIRVVAQLKYNATESQKG